MEEQSITVNVHNVRVDSVYELGDVYPADQFIIKFGNGRYDGTVTMFVTDGEWEAAVVKIAEKRKALKVERAQRDAMKASIQEFIDNEEDRL